jgi:GNAT superfamily N-acetyltransferase
MADMLVRLYDLPEVSPMLEKLLAEGIEIRPAIAPEKFYVVDWVRSTFGSVWAGECDVAISNKPSSCIVAISNKTLLGFACHEATYRNFFGPIGVCEDARKRGIGKALLLASLHAMHEQGYAYAIIGGAGPNEFYQKIVDAILIPGSDPGIYKGMLKSSR